MGKLHISMLITIHTVSTVEVANPELVEDVNLREDEVKPLAAEGVNFDTCSVDFVRLEVETEDRRESQGMDYKVDSQTNTWDTLRQGMGHEVEA